MPELPVVTDSFFLGPDIAFDGEKERGFEVWGKNRQFYWAEVNDSADRMSIVSEPFPTARWAHHDALLALSCPPALSCDAGSALHGRQG